jgi:hypothetical protein
MYSLNGDKEKKKGKPQEGQRTGGHTSYLRDRRSLPARETIHGTRFFTEVASRGEELSMPRAQYKFYSCQGMVDITGNKLV